MTTVAWLLLALGCSVWMYRRGYTEGVEVAKRLGVLAVEQERLRCYELRMTQVFGPKAERLTQPKHAECN